MISFIQHTPFVNLEVQGIHAWRQSQTMWNVKNFVRHDNNILNPRINKFNGGEDNIYRYEFPLMQWTLAQVQKIFGEEIWLVRIIMYLMGLLAILSFTLIVKDIFDDWLTAVLSSVLLMYSPVFYYYTWNPLPDNWALAFGLLYLACILRHRKSSKTRHLLLAGIALSLATLCKLPYLMFSIVSIWFFVSDLIHKRGISSRMIKSALSQLVLILPAITWYIWVIPSWEGNPILTGQIEEEFGLSEYLSILKYHLLTMFPQILLSIPIIWIFIIGVYSFLRDWKNQSWIFSLIGISFLYLLFEFKPIGIEHDYYMMPFLPWMYVLVAFGVFHLLKHNYGYPLVIMFCVVSSIFTAVQTKDKWSIDKTGINKDVLVYSEELKSAVPNNELCIILNDHTTYIFSNRIDKMGYIFQSDNLPIEWIDDMVRNYGVNYMYSDSRIIDESSEFEDYVQKVILQKGSVKVIELKLPE